jgi:putative sterol carrier protein
MTLYKFPSDAWIKKLAEELNKNEDYKRSASNWEGDFVFVVEPDDGYTDEAYLYLGLYHGDATGAEMMESVDQRQTEYLIRSTYSTWRKVIEGKLDPIQGMMTKQLRLTGNLMMVMRYPKAAQEIVASCAHIPTDWEV